MRSFTRAALGIALAGAMAGCGHGVAGVTPTAGTAAQQSVTRAANGVQYFGLVRDNAAQACGAARFDEARCHAWVRIDVPTSPLGASPDAIFGYHPLDLQSAYKMPSATKGLGQTVAIVDAYDDPNAESDLAVYRKTWALSPCTTKNGCFRKVNQNGKPSPLPAADTTGWSIEESLDLDMVSASCPKCKIILVEGNSNSFADLAKSVDSAAALGADAISNSYGGGESGFSYNSHYKHAGHMVTASNGDSGYGAQFPADSQWVTAVGGTTLTKASNTRGWSETVWAGTGSGCSSVAPKPAWQKDTGCKRRTIGDTAADANPGTGVAVYDTYRFASGWIELGGTSVSAPLIAGVYALAGNAKTLVYGSSTYGAKAGTLYDVTSGSNGTCTPKYLCTGVKGYDGPTGNGTPHGVGAF